MGPNMYEQNLKNICKLLIAFEQAPKKIQERQITEWFTVGESLFEEFHNLGVNTAWNFVLLNDKPEVLEIVQQVARNQNWLQSFVTIYPNIRIDLDGSYSGAVICKVRSGLQFLLTGFKDNNLAFNVVLKDLEEFGELEEFDSQLKSWVETGHRPHFFLREKYPNIPTSHWWWF